MNDLTQLPYLSVLTVAPLVGGAVVAMIPRTSAELAKRVAFGWSVAVLVVTAAMAAQYSIHGDRFQFRESYKWIPQWNARFTFATDGIALVMLLLIAVLVPLVILASWHDADGEDAKVHRPVGIYFALLLFLESTMLGVFAAQDIFLFYLFFEVMLVPMYFLIGSFGGARRQYAAVKFFLYSLVGGLFMLAAVVGLWVLGGHTFDWTDL
jgi:NADH-quinone oxidoreductase subunit M